MRESRELAKKLSTVRGLGEQDKEDSDALNWVMQMREKEKEKKLAEERVSFMYVS